MPPCGPLRSSTGLDGWRERKKSKAREKAAYKALQAARDRIAELEGAAAAAPEGADSPTPGEEMEVETHE